MLMQYIVMTCVQSWLQPISILIQSVLLCAVPGFAKREWHYLRQNGSVSMALLVCIIRGCCD